MVWFSNYSIEEIYLYCRQNGNIIQTVVLIYMQTHNKILLITITNRVSEMREKRSINIHLINEQCYSSPPRAENIPELLTSTMMQFKNTDFMSHQSFSMSVPGSTWFYWAK